MFLGRGAGEILVKAIAEAKERVLVSSPWIGEKYADMLVRKALEGAKVYVITSDLEDNEGKLLASAAERYGEEELRRAEYEAARLRFEERSARLAAVRNAAVAAVSAALALAASAYFAAYAPYLYASAGGLAALAALLYAASSRKAGRIRGRLIEAEAEAQRIARALEADREKIRRNLAVLVAPTAKAFVHAKLYVVDGRAWAGSANLTASGMQDNYEVLVEVDAGTAEGKFMELWARLASSR